VKLFRFLKRVSKKPVPFSIPFVDFGSSKTTGVAATSIHPGIPIHSKSEYDPETGSYHILVDYVFCSSDSHRYGRYNASEILIVTLGTKRTYCMPWKIVQRDSRHELVDSKIKVLGLENNMFFGDNLHL